MKNITTFIYEKCECKDGKCACKAKKEPKKGAKNQIIDNVGDVKQEKTDYEPDTKFDSVK